MGGGVQAVGCRSRRSDAEANRERVLAAAVHVFATSGLHTPIGIVAKTAGVGVATLYRSFANREALMAELESRAYGVLNDILDAVDADGLEGIPAVEQFLLQTLNHEAYLILPLHGAPPLIDRDAVAARQRIDRRLEHFLAQGRRAGAVTSDANATDVIMCSALITQPLRHGPDWSRSAARHVALFVGGLASGRVLPGPAVTQSDMEQAFRATASLHDRDRQRIGRATASEA